jgi:pimeloyl-ACP methyl ester carboxylesterase
MPTVDANGCKFYYEIDDYSDPWVKDTETVWLQHGVGRSTKFWYHWVPALSRSYRVIRRDMRGHGQSSVPPPDHKWSLDELPRTCSRSWTR